MRSNRRTRLLVLAGLTALTAAVALTLVPAALNSSTSNGLSAYVVADLRGPVPASGTVVRNFIHVINSNDLASPFATRQAIGNAFVIDSVDISAFVDGVQAGSSVTIAAPPNSGDFAAGRWPTTVTFDSGSYVVGKPAVDPGENAVAVFFGEHFEFGSGKYVFKYVLHGTFNGKPVDLGATSPQITATG